MDHGVKHGHVEHVAFGGFGGLPDEHSIDDQEGFFQQFLDALRTVPGRAVMLDVDVVGFALGLHIPHLLLYLNETREEQGGEHFDVHVCAQVDALRVPLTSNILFALAVVIARVLA